MKNSKKRTLNDEDTQLKKIIEKSETQMPDFNLKTQSTVIDEVSYLKKRTEVNPKMKRKHIYL